jgi:hypothetical protein
LGIIELISEDIILAFKESACGEIDLTSSGMNRYLVEVPFSFTDGDHYVVILRQEEHKWVLSDEGHTFMHLSYELRDKEYEAGNRRKIIDEILTSYQIENRDGELVLSIPPGRYGDALFTYVQAITRITDMTFLDRATVKSTFREDFNKLVSEKGKEAGIENITFGYTNPVHDPQARYPVDARLNGVTSRQVLVFAVGNDDQCQTATIVLLQWEKWGEKFHSIAVFRDQSEINRQYLMRLSDVLGKQLPSLDSARDRLRTEFADLVVRNS